MNMPVELAPQQKIGLSLNTPVFLASGVSGYGDVLPPGIDLAALGAVVTAPVTRRPVRGYLPQLEELAGGLLWQRGNWNPGARVVLRDFAPLWQRSPMPIIVHIGASEPEEVADLATLLERTPGVAGLELDAPPAGEDPGAVMKLVRATRAAADLPLLVRVPLSAGDGIVRACVDAAADALVVAQPPAGLRIDRVQNVMRRGSLHGPVLLPYVTARVAELAQWVDLPLVACGGVHSVEDALTLMASGAKAVQIDTAVWVDPGLPGAIVAGLQS